MSARSWDQWGLLTADTSRSAVLHTHVDVAMNSARILVQRLRLRSATLSSSTCTKIASGRATGNHLNVCSLELDVTHSIISETLAFSVVSGAFSHRTHHSHHFV